MSIHYPMQKHGRFGLGMGVTFEVLHTRFGADLGEWYHADIGHRIRTNQEIDQKLGGPRIFEFYDVFRKCAGAFGD